jgi:hypothetical protein
MELVSCYDIADAKGCRIYETWYHTFIIGTLAMYHDVEYQVLSNCETGEGRPDVRIIPIVQSKSICILFEFKLSKTDDRNEMKKNMLK